MGYPLKGTAIETTASDIISSAATQGTIQRTSSGELIILMADGQTIGGYPRVGQVILVDLAVLAQKKPGEFIQFEIVSIAEAETLYLKQEEELHLLEQRMKKLLWR